MSTALNDAREMATPDVAALLCDAGLPDGVLGVRARRRQTVRSALVHTGGAVA